MDALKVESKAHARNPSVICYLCGRNFGTQSIGIHEKVCLAKYESAQASLPKSQRRPPPAKPSVEQPIHGGADGGAGSVGASSDRDAQNQAALDVYLNQSRVGCPNCGRKFGGEDRLAIHLKSCAPGGFFAQQQQQLAKGREEAKEGVKEKERSPRTSKTAAGRGDADAAGAGVRAAKAPSGHGQSASMAEERPSTRGADAAAGATMRAAKPPSGHGYSASTVEERPSTRGAVATAPAGGGDATPRAQGASAPPTLKSKPAVRPALTGATFTPPQAGGGAEEAAAAVGAAGAGRRVKYTQMLIQAQAEQALLAREQAGQPTGPDGAAASSSSSSAAAGASRAPAPGARALFGPAAVSAGASGVTGVAMTMSSRSTTPTSGSLQHTPLSRSTGSLVPVAAAASLGDAKDAEAKQVQKNFKRPPPARRAGGANGSQGSVNGLASRSTEALPDGNGTVVEAGFAGRGETPRREVEDSGVGLDEMEEKRKQKRQTMPAALQAQAVATTMAAPAGPPKLPPKPKAESMAAFCGECGFEFGAVSAAKFCQDCGTKRAKA
ncbi:hypothetical protein HK101_009259 [Irineochytrium annulatum]|nr:hypothetical protein HK101_009259 [Irineochytrium annulatum]